MKKTKKILVALVACVMISTSYAGPVLKIERDMNERGFYDAKIPDFITVELYSDERATTKLGEEVFHKKTPYAEDRYRAERVLNYDGESQTQCQCPIRFTFNLRKITDTLTTSVRPWYTITFDGTGYRTQITQVDCDDWENFCAKIDATPAGTIIPWATVAIPKGFLAANGALIAITDYPRLFAAIGTTYGGDGRSNFALPDLRGLFIRGVDAGKGIDHPARPLGSYQEDAFQGHNHGVSFTGRDGRLTASPHVVGYDCSTDQGHVTGSDGFSTYPNPKRGGSADAGLGSGIPRISNETRPKNMALNYVIKY